MSTHEDFSRKEVFEGPSDRSFGWVFFWVFTVSGAWPLLWGRHARPWPLAAAAIILAITLIRPALLHPANRAWMKFGLLLSKLTNPIVTALLFFFVITPMGLLMRITGKNPLRLRRDATASSYWIERNPPGPKPETMSQQF